MLPPARSKTTEMWSVTGFLLPLTPGGCAAYLCQLRLRHQLVLGRLQLHFHRSEDFLQVEPSHFVEQVLDGFVCEGRLGSCSFGGRLHML